MIIYYIIYFLIILLSFFEFTNLKEKTKIKIISVVPLIVLMMVAGLRHYSIGTDTYNYQIIYSNMTLEKLFSSSSIVYNVYCLLIKTLFNGNPVVFNFCNACIINVSLYFFIKKYSYNFTYSLCVYMALGFYFNTMNQCREYLSIALLLWAFDGCLQKKDIKFIIFSLLAIFTHNISVILVGALLVIRIIRKIRPRHLVLMMIIMMFIFYNYDVLIEYFAKIFSGYKIYFASWVGLYTGLKTNSTIFYFSIYSIIELFAIIMYLINRKYTTTQKNEVFSALLVLNMFNIIFSALTFKIYMLLRVTMLFSIFLVVLLPNLFHNYFKNKKIVNFISYVILFIFLYLNIKQDGAGVVPYRLFNSI